MADDYTPEQKAKIARHFLYTTPHGEAKDVVKDLKKVVGAKIIDDAWVKTAMDEYNNKRFVICEGDTSKVICSPQNKVQANMYLNPDKVKVMVIDPVEQKIVEEQDASHLPLASGKVEECRQAITKSLKEYLDGFFEDGTSPNSVAKGMGSVMAAPNGMIAVVISYKNLNQNNYWTGGWQSEWTTNISKAGKVSMEGRIRLNVHYYEDGNVQLNSNFKEEAEIVVGSAEDTAKSMIEQIMERENAFQNKLAMFYVQMSGDIFKSMRRKLPKTQVKMDWRARTHNLVSEAASQ